MDNSYIRGRKDMYKSIAKSGDLSAGAMQKKAASFKIKTKLEMEIWREFNRHNREYQQVCSQVCRESKGYEERMSVGLKKKRAEGYKRFLKSNCLMRGYYDRVWNKHHAQTIWVLKKINSTPLEDM